MRIAGVWQTSQRSCRTCRQSGPKWTLRSQLRFATSLIDRTRNIGIIAHIDAGKTTTTERMLYYSGHTRRIGDVDEGSTVTDFLPAERARGITIQSAAITFHWPPENPQGDEKSDSYRINLIDTPGHADFTFEVLRSLRVLDGAVCVLDGVAGVEAQTEKVWTQASSYRIPRIVYVNKLDRDGAAFGRTVTEIGVRLNAWPAVCQIPWWTQSHTKFVGVGDVVALRGLRWQGEGDGKHISAFSYEQLKTEDEKLSEELKRARVALIELLSEHDENLVEEFLACNEDHMAIPPSAIVAALRRCVLNADQVVVPVFAGASFRNIGIQPLIDAIVALFPAPNELPAPEIRLSTGKTNLASLMQGTTALMEPSRTSHNVQRTRKDQKYDVKSLEACGLAFKVVHDAKRGVLVYVRVYHGSIVKGASLFNTNLGVVERPPRLYHMYASDAVEVSSIEAGQIGVIPGLRHTRTGDTLLVYGGGKAAKEPPEPVRTLQLRPIDVPPPVFFVSIEPESLSSEKHLNDCLDLILREDPSFSVSTDVESGQTHLAGMGELHLEIARDRLLSDFKAKATMGQIEIGYRETVTAPSDSATEVFDREIMGRRTRAASTISVQPRQDGSILEEELATITHLELPDNNLLTIMYSEDVTNELPSHLTLATVLKALRSGVSAALCRGPTHHFPIHSAYITVQLNPTSQLFPDSSASGISNAARIATRRALQSSADKQDTVLMEPVMLVNISVNEDDMGAVMHDLSAARGGQVLSLDDASLRADGMDSTSSAAPERYEMPVIDPQKIYRPQDPFETSSIGKFSSTEYIGAPVRQREILARVPLQEMVGYLKYLRGLTKGRGTFTMKVDAFERMGAQRMKVVLQSLKGG